LSETAISFDVFETGSKVSVMVLSARSARIRFLMVSFVSDWASEEKDRVRTTAPRAIMLFVWLRQDSATGKYRLR